MFKTALHLIFSDYTIYVELVFEQRFYLQLSGLYIYFSLSCLQLFLQVFQSHVYKCDKILTRQVRSSKTLCNIQVYMFFFQMQFRQWQILPIFHKVFYREFSCQVNIKFLIDDHNYDLSVKFALHINNFILGIFIISVMYVMQ